MAGKKMPLSEAQKIVNDYNDACNDGDIHSFTIDADFLRKVIDQDGCQLVRIYLGVNGEVDKSRIGLAPGQTLVIIGADKSGSNIKFDENTTEVYEDLDNCPPLCFGTNGTIL